MRALLGARLRRLRQARSLTPSEAGRAIQMPGAKLLRVEQGQAQIRAAELAGLLISYEVSDRQQREVLSYLAAQSTTRRWWHSYAAVLPDWFEKYIDLEEGASLIRTYHAQHIPGLLQTTGYATAVAQMSKPYIDASDTELRVEMLNARQAPLTGPRPLRLWALIDEAVLLRPVGDADVMRGQLRHLLWAGTLPNVTIQIVPLASGVAVPGSFSILRYADSDLPDIVYVEYLTGALYLSEPHEWHHYNLVMHTLAVGAKPPSDSAQTLRRYLGDPPRARRPSPGQATDPRCEPIRADRL